MYILLWKKYHPETIKGDLNFVTGWFSDTFQDNKDQNKGFSEIK